MDGWMDFNNGEQCIIIIHSFKMSFHQLIFLFLSLRISSAMLRLHKSSSWNRPLLKLFNLYTKLFKSVQTMRKSIFYNQLFISFNIKDSLLKEVIEFIYYHLTTQFLTIPFESLKLP